MNAARVFVFAALAAVAIFAGAETSAYPPLDAIRLVVERDLQSLKQMDGGDWSMDTKRREWSVQRPAHPGVLDTTRLFNVAYRVDGKTLSCWFVDLEAKTVKKLATCGRDSRPSEQNGNVGPELR